ncbi:unnamed protein product [Urochloa humidicola]
MSPMEVVPRDLVMRAPPPSSLAPGATAGRPSSRATTPWLRPRRVGARRRCAGEPAPRRLTAFDARAVSPRARHQRRLPALADCDASQRCTASPERRHIQARIL